MIDDAQKNQLRIILSLFASLYCMSHHDQLGPGIVVDDRLRFLRLIIVSVVLRHRIAVSHHTGITLRGGWVGWVGVVVPTVLLVMSPAVWGMGLGMTFFHVALLALLAWRTLLAISCVFSHRNRRAHCEQVAHNWINNEKYRISPLCEYPTSQLCLTASHRSNYGRPDVLHERWLHVLSRHGLKEYWTSLPVNGVGRCENPLKSFFSFCWSKLTE